MKYIDSSATINENFALITCSFAIVADSRQTFKVQRAIC
jgi:hypothetical protein